MKVASLIFLLALPSWGQNARAPQVTELGEFKVTEGWWRGSRNGTLHNECHPPPNKAKAGVCDELITVRRTTTQLALLRSDSLGNPNEPGKWRTRTGPWVHRMSSKHCDYYKAKVKHQNVFLSSLCRAIKIEIKGLKKFFANAKFEDQKKIMRLIVHPEIYVLLGNYAKKHRAGKKTDALEKAMRENFLELLEPKEFEKELADYIRQPDNATPLLQKAALAIAAKYELFLFHPKIDPAKLNEKILEGRGTVQGIFTAILPIPFIFFGGDSVHRYYLPRDVKPTKIIKKDTYYSMVTIHNTRIFQLQ